MQVHNCNTMPCPFRRGTTAVMDMDFSSPMHATHLTPVIFANVLGIEIRYPVPDDLIDGCGDVSPNGCPLSAGTRTTYNFRFPINPSYPPVTVGVRLELRNGTSQDDGAVLACFGVDVAVRLF